MVCILGVCDSTASLWGSEQWYFLPPRWYNSDCCKQLFVCCYCRCTEFFIFHTMIHSLTLGGFSSAEESTKVNNVRVWLCKCVWVCSSRSCTKSVKYRVEFTFSFLWMETCGVNFRQQNNIRSLLAYVADTDVLYNIRWMFVVFFSFWWNRCACVVDKYHGTASMCKYILRITTTPFLYRSASFAIQ